jgi:hypothetical protein
MASGPPAEKQFPTGGDDTFGERGLASAGLFVQMSLGEQIAEFFRGLCDFVEEVVEGDKVRSLDLLGLPLDLAKSRQVDHRIWKRPFSNLASRWRDCGEEGKLYPRQAPPLPEDAWAQAV